MDGFGGGAGRDDRVVPVGTFSHREAEVEDGGAVDLVQPFDELIADALEHGVVPFTLVACGHHAYRVVISRH